MCRPTIMLVVIAINFLLALFYTQLYVNSYIYLGWVVICFTLLLVYYIICATAVKLLKCYR